MQQLKLEDFLRRLNPEVESVEAPNLPDDEGKDRKRNRNPSSKNPSWRFPEKARKWENFSLESFNSVYAETLQDVLGLVQKFNEHPAIPDFPFCEIWDEDSLEALLIRSNQAIVGEALEVAQAHLNEQNSHDRIYVSI